MRTRFAFALLGLAATACGPLTDPEADEAEPEELFTSVQQGLVTCASRQDTGYRNGVAFTITVVTADGKPVELATANAYSVMQDAAARDGVYLSVVSGFRTMAEQQYLYNCYLNKNCNNGNLAAQPGYSNHQSGHALDLNTSAGGVYNWLSAHGPSFGFNRTVPSEAWHWEWWGGGPGGGPCGPGGALTDDNCTQAEADGCGHFGCGCVDHACNGIFCPGSGCSAQHTANCGAYGSGCADGKCSGGTSPGSGCTAKETLDCGKFGCGCVDHACNGGAACAGTGCTWRETHDCAGFGVNCADHQCSGGYGPGNGCTGKETTDCTAAGCGCVDHKCSGGAKCDGSGSTARNVLDCGGFGCHSVDAQCSGGACPGNGCTAKQTADCSAKGCGCVDEVCSGGTSCAGTGCTLRQTADCQKLGATCALGACVTATGPVVVDAGAPIQAPGDDAGTTFMPDGGTVDDDAGMSEVAHEGDPTMDLPIPPQAPPTAQQVIEDRKVHGGCSAAPGSLGLLMLLLTPTLARRHKGKR